MFENAPTVLHWRAGPTTRVTRVVDTLAADRTVVCAPAFAVDDVSELVGQVRTRPMCGPDWHVSAGQLLALEPLISALVDGGMSGPDAVEQAVLLTVGASRIEGDDDDV